MTSAQHTLHHSHLLFAIALATLALSATATHAQSKSTYNLFNPTPTDMMRAFSADRPDGTESPYTVDAGHYQIELSFLSYTHNKNGGTETSSLTILDTNLKAGLTNNIDLQLVFGTYEREKINPTGSPNTTEDGFGDTQLRLKINLWGNDGGTTAFGIMPFIKLPSGTDLSNDHIEGGIAHMLAWNIADNWGLGFMAEFDAVYDDIEDDYDLEFIHTAVLGFHIGGPFAAYLEYIGVLTTESSDNYQAIFSTGITYEIHGNLVLDLGTQIGLTAPADDVNVFAGFTWRF